MSKELFVKRLKDPGFSELERLDKFVQSCVGQNTVKTLIQGRAAFVRIDYDYHLVEDPELDKIRRQLYKLDHWRLLVAPNFREEVTVLIKLIKK